MDTNATQRNKQGGAITDRDRYYQMCELGVEEQVEKFPYAGLSKKHLDLISCVQLGNFDVDNIDSHGGANTATLFKPSGPIDAHLKDILSEQWYDLGGGQAPRLYPEYRSGWFMLPWDKDDWLGGDGPVIDRFGGTAWLFMENDAENFEEAQAGVQGTGLILPYGFLNNAHTHQYFSDVAFFPKDKSKPHLACIISETLVSHDRLLRSEVHAAVALIKYQLFSWNNEHCGDHHTKPVMLYTFQYDTYARITQAYFDRSLEKIVLRQSRMFDLRGDKPTNDAWLLLQWMLNTPVGDTFAKEEDTSLPIRVKEPAVSPAKPTHITVTSPSGTSRDI